MHLRPYEPRDISSIATITALCNLTDPLECFRNRNMETWWLTYRNSVMRELKMMLLMPSVVCVVVEGDAGDAVLERDVERDVRNEVVGLAIWEREGEGKEQRGSFWSELNRFLHSTTMKYFSFWDPTAHRKNAALLQPVISAECPEATFKKFWHLHGLFILPTCQRRGLGALALQWGIDQATSEHVPIVVNASSRGVGLYEKMGFRGVMKQEFDQFFETGERGMWVMVWNPEGHEKLN